MKCKKCGKDNMHTQHLDTIRTDFHKFEPAEPEAAPAAERITKLVADNGPRVDTRRVPSAHYFCAECGKTPEPCHHFSRSWPTTQATEARPTACPICSRIWNDIECSFCHHLKSDEKSEAAAQKVEQPAVEPQKLIGPVDNSLLCDDPDCGDCYDKRDALEYAQKKAGSTRPEMPPEIWDELKDEIEGEQSMRFDDVPQGSTLAVNKYICDIAERASAWLRERLSKLNGAASVQQEPPPYWQCPNNKSHSLKYGPYLYGTKIKEMYCAEGCNVKAVLKSQPAAPRTQGREPKYDPQKDPSTNWVLNYAIELENIQRSRNHMLEDERGNRSPVLTRGTIIDTIWKYLASQPEPAPKCPQCRSLQVNVKYSLLMEGRQDLLFCRDCHHREFFTALPEATKKEE